MNELSLFTGGGGGVLGGKLLGWKSIGYVEINAFCQKLLAQRIEDGHLERAPIFGDIRGFIKSGAALEYRGFADVVTAGFPCQPFSVAGKSEGEFDPRNMWPETIEVIRQVGPRFALLENVPGILAHPYFGTIIGDLSESGFNVEWDVISASSLGAQHLRERLWIFAYAKSESREEAAEKVFTTGGEGEARPSLVCSFGGNVPRASRTIHPPRVVRSLHGVANRLERSEALGNGQYPAVVESAWKILSGDR